MLLGAVLAFGVMWPAIGRQAGIWYPAGLTERDFSGLYGYKVSTLISIPLCPLHCQVPAFSIAVTILSTPAACGVA